jgi:hypothetical protein
MNEWDFGGYDPFIRFAAGLYIGGCDMVGQIVGAHTINIVGEQSDDPRQSCTLAQAERVVVRPGPSQEGGGIFVFQDAAIIVLRCMTLEGGSATGVQCRQTPASDVAFVKFGGEQPLRYGATAAQNCGLNLGGTIWVGNSLMAVVTADSNSRLTVAAPIIAANPATAQYLAMSYHLSLIEFQFPISGPLSVQNGSRVWRAGMITNTSRVPLRGGCFQADPVQPGYCY